MSAGVQRSQASQAGLTTLPFSVDEFRSRLERARAEIERRELDALLVMGPEDLYYLTGYRSMGYFAWQVLVVTPGDHEPLMISRTLEQMIYEDNSWSSSYRAYGDSDDPLLHTAEVLREMGLADARLGWPEESSYLSAAQARRLRALLPEVTWLDTTQLVPAIRVVKTPAELAVMRQVAPLTAAAFGAAGAVAREGATENAIAAAFLEAMIASGSHAPSLPLIGAGRRSAFGHASWENRRLDRGDVVFLEGGACLWRYHVGLMRTLSIGPPSAEVRALQEASVAGADAAIAAAKPGASTGDVDAACRRAVKDLGMERYFRHRTGYSIGMGFDNWVDGFSIRPGGEDILQENMVFHIVPFLSTGELAVALSETALITADGAEPMVDVARRIMVC